MCSFGLRSSGMSVRVAELPVVLTWLVSGTIWFCPPHVLTQESWWFCVDHNEAGHWTCAHGSEKARCLLPFGSLSLSEKLKMMAS